MDIGVLGKRDADHRFVFLLAEDDADGGRFFRQLLLVVEVVHVHLHLAQVLMSELADLQIDEHVAAQQTMVKKTRSDPVMPSPSNVKRRVGVGCEEEAFAEFEKKAFDLIDDGGFEVGFGIACLLVQPEEFEHEGFLEQVVGAGDDLAFRRQFANAFLVTAECQAFVEAAIELALELAHGPVPLGGFDFVEAAFVVIPDADQKDVVCPASA